MPYSTLLSSNAAAAPIITVGEPLMEIGETLLTMRAEVYERIGKRTDRSEMWLDLQINRGYQGLCASLDLDQLHGSYSFLTVIDQPLYLLPSVVGYTYGVAIVDETSYPTLGGIGLMKTDLEGYRRLHNLSATVTHFFRHGKMLVIWPTPDAVYPLAVDFRLIPVPLALDTDSPILPEDMHELIILGATYRGFNSVMEYDLGAKAKAAYASEIRDRINTLAAERSGFARMFIARDETDLTRG